MEIVIGLIIGGFLGFINGIFLICAFNIGKGEDEE